MKIWLALILLIPCLAAAQPDVVDAADEQPEQAEPDKGKSPAPTKLGEKRIIPVTGDAVETEDPNDIPVTWVDSGHAVVTNQTVALVEWMDEFFGDPAYNLEQAESFLRLEFVNDWVEGDGNDFSARLRGKVQLPRISNRLNLVFSGDEGEAVTEEERREEDGIGLQLKVREGNRSRFDVTMGWASGGLRPGVRYRLEGSHTEKTSFRFIQRLLYENDEGFYTRANYDLYHALDEDNMLRWTSRIKYGEETEGVEWRTGLSLFQRWFVDSKRPVAFSYFGSATGVTRPDDFVKNYRLGILWRRKVYREFLFVEAEPAFNYRRLSREHDREPAWSLVLRLEIALERDLRRIRD